MIDATFDCRRIRVIFMAQSTLESGRGGNNKIRKDKT